MPCELFWIVPAFLLPLLQQRTRCAELNAESHWGSATSIQSLDFDLFSCFFPGSHTKQENYSANQLAWLMIWMGDASRIVKMELFLTVIIIMRSRNGSFYEVDLYANFRFIRFTLYYVAFPTRLGSLFLSCHNWLWLNLKRFKIQKHDLNFRNRVDFE